MYTSNKPLRSESNLKRYTKSTKSKGESAESEDQETATPPPLPFNTQNLEGVGWKFLLRRRSRLDGLMIWRRTAFREAGLPKSQRVERRRKWVPGRAEEETWRALCMLQRKEPGCVVGEHMHVRDLDLEDEGLDAMEVDWMVA